MTLSSGGGGGGGGGGGAGTIPDCVGATGTIKMYFNNWSGVGQIVQTSQGMLSTDIMVATFTTGATVATGAKLQITDNAPNSAGFYASLATTPCTFTSSVKGGMSSASWNLSLQPNTQYFVNIKGDSPLSVKLGAQ